VQDGREADMKTSRSAYLAGGAGLIAALLIAAAALAESRPSTPSKGKGFYTLPEKDDEVLLRGKTKPKGSYVPDMDSDQSGMARGKGRPKPGGR
jgi:hypothetical protein